MRRCMGWVLVGGLMAIGAASGEEVRPGVLRTPEARFAGLAGFDFEPHYAMIDGYRVHYLDEGPRDGEVVFLLHGEPSWSYLYRKMIPVLVAAGHRCIVPDLIGFGRSDKPTSMDVHTYAFHVTAMERLVSQLDLTNVTFFGQDWGGLIGLRVVAENPQRFARIVVANTGLPTGAGVDLDESSAFQQWKRTNQAMIDRGDIPVGRLVSSSVGDPALEAAYDAPFPDPSYKAGPLIMPQRVPVTADDPARQPNEAAWEVLRGWQKPLLTAFSDGDPITRGGDRIFQESVPGALGQAHTTIVGAGHFLQEQRGEELAAVIVKFMAANPLAPRGIGFAGQAGLTADQIPVAHTPPGYWKSMPGPVLADCTEPLAAGAIDMRGTWEVVEATMNGEPFARMIGSRQRIEQCGNRVVITAGGVTHDMRCDGSYKNGVNDIGEPSTGGRPISVAASFENGVHVLRPKGTSITVERELDRGELVWRYGPAIVARLRREAL